MKKKGKKLITFIIALAIALTTVFTGATVNVEASAAPTFGYAWAAHDDATDTWSENPNGAIHTEMNGASINSMSPVYFYYVDETGTRTRLTPSELSTSDGAVVSIHESDMAPGMIELNYNKVGTATIDYNHNGTIYKVDVSVVLPPVALYSTSTADELTFTQEFTITETNNQFYLATTEDWILTDVTLRNGLQDIASVSIDSTGTYATITVTGTPSSGRWYDVTFSASSTKYNQIMTDNNWGVCLYNGKPDLQYYWGQWDNGTIFENREDGIRNTWNTTPGNDGFMFFYYVDNGVETFVAPTELTSSDPSVVTITAHPTNPNAALLEVVGFGNANIQYTVNGKTYTMEVKSELPEIGFYSSPTASESTFLPEFARTNSADTIYLVGNDGWKLSSATLRDEFSNIATIDLDTTNGYATVKITGTPEDGRWYNVICSADHPDKEYDITDYYAGLRLTDARPDVKFHWGNWDNGTLTENTQEGFRSSWNTAPGNTMHGFFYYVEGSNQIPLTADDLKSSDTNVIKVYAAQGNPAAICVEVVGFGEATVDYTVNGKTYSMEVVSELPEVGFYSSTTPSQQTFLNQATVTDDNNTFYFVGRDGWKVTSVTLEQDFADIAQVELDTTNGYATITVTQMPEYGSYRWYNLRYSASNETTGQSMGDNGMGIAIVNGNPFYFEHQDTEWMLSMNGRIDSEIYYRYSESELLSAEVIDVRVTGGDVDAVDVTKITNADETFWAVYAKEVGTSEITITHKDPDDATKTIDYTFSISVVDKMLWINHFMSTNVENFGVPGDVSERNLIISVDYYDEDTGEIETIDVTDKATYNWQMRWFDGSNDSTVRFNKNVVTVTLADNELPGDSFGYECYISYDFNGETLTAHMSDYVDVVESYYFVTGNELPTGFGYGDTAIITPIAKKVSYDYTTNTRSEVIVTDDLSIGWFKNVEDLTLYCNGVEVQDGQEVPYNASDVYTIKRGPFWGENEYALRAEVYLNHPDGQEYLGWYFWEVAECTCPHPASEYIYVGGVSATCDTPGCTDDTECGVCGVIVKAGKEIPALGHSYKSTLTPATCTVAGQKVYTCACGASYKETIRPDGHNFQAGACIVCQTTDPNYKPETDVVVVPDTSVQESANEAATDLSNTITETIQAVKEEFPDAAVSTDRLVETVKDILLESNDEDIVEVVQSVSNETLEKIIVAIEEEKEIATTVMVQVVVEEDFDEATKADAEKIETFVGKNGTITQYLDIAVLIQAKDETGNVETLGTIDEPTKSITFTLSIPENLQKDGRTFFVVRVHDGGTAEKIAVVDNGDGTVSFTEDKFSTYALAYNDFVNPFTDVDPEDPDASWYIEPIFWAVQNGVTTGYSETAFKPDLYCTRGQVVTFLYRALGKPEPSSHYNPFVDVDPTEYYGKPVLWAVERGITNGLSATEFGPDETVTRGQFVTFLWRAAGSPEPTTTNHTFKDIKSGEYYYKAVLWAVENGVTNGTSATTFEPDSDCTRGQVVTFLYRAYGK